MSGQLTEEKARHQCDLLEKTWDTLNEITADLKNHGLNVNAEIYTSLRSTKSLITLCKTHPRLSELMPQEIDSYLGFCAGCCGQDVVTRVKCELRNVEDRVIIQAFSQLGNEYALKLQQKTLKTWEPLQPVVVCKGLDNVHIQESKICFIDGEASKLFYRGYSIEDLAEKSTYEETAYLLIYGKLPTKSELDGFQAKLASYRPLEDTLLQLIRSFPVSGNPMDALRTSVSALGLYDPQPLTDSMEARIDRALRILAKAPTMIAAFDRIRNRKDPLAPKSSLSHAANFLYMLTGKEPDPYDAHVMDVALILHAEHEMNASTFACTVTASTLADMYSMICSGIGTLRGPLHGGANEAALKTVLEVGDSSRAEDYVTKALAEKKRIMGFGHRIYKTWDPRYRVLKKIGADLAAKKGQDKFFETAVAVETSALKHLSGTTIFPNVDSYSGVVFHMLEIPTDLFTPIFAMSRIAGWAAHAIEYLEDNRLIRPKSLYVGDLGLPFVPIESRGK